MLVDAHVILSLQSFQIVTYIVAGTALLVFDWFLTIEAEIRYIWHPPYTLGTVLYFLTKYLAFMDSGLAVYHQVAYSLSEKQCAALFRVTGLMVMLGISLAEWILALRVWALYERSRYIAIIILVVGISSLVFSTVGNIAFGQVETFTAMATISPSLPGCFPHEGSKAAYIGPVILALTETAILALTLIKAIQQSKGGTTSFMRAFFRAGIVYYFCLQAVSQASWVVLAMHMSDFNYLVTGLQRSMHSVMSARIILDIRRAIHGDVVGSDETNGNESIGVIVFAGGREDGS
ncbi:hypothetical protein BDQ12DRAFT_326451 [Crucibulum laeve]|uniref:DUF6533 domain-containing protein n=1 Tax=Crucibulum laeve TaxID=68775 RepID=A0A5C3LQ65_9AGAR|nr:hypothetical protein BDQ12DRAFT_326451 [Crucibulum laeve]